MRRRLIAMFGLAGIVWASGLCDAAARVVFRGTSPYHHIRVVDRGGIRMLSFDGSMETRMSLANPLLGHFEYTEYFQMPWLWNTNIQRVLTVGLGGGRVHRAFGLYFPEVHVDAVEIDPVVVRVAEQYFGIQATTNLAIHVSDGRVFLRRAQRRYDVIIVDAYTANRYGSFIPHHLATREFFEMARDRLPEDGVLAYNVIGQIRGPRSGVVASIHRTMKDVFPQVYLFPARESQNVVLIATRNPGSFTANEAREKARELVRERIVTLPTFMTRVQSFVDDPPPVRADLPVLTDDYAPVNGLLRITP
jgi:spermidine synthase